MLHDGGHLKLKKPPARLLAALEAYGVTKAALRADVAATLAANATKRARLGEIVADPACARPEELTASRVGNVFAGRLRHSVTGTLMIAGIPAPSRLQQRARSRCDALARRGPPVLLVDRRRGQRRGEMPE